MKNVLYTLLLILAISLNLKAQSFMTENGKAIFHSEVPLHTFSGSSEHLVGMINLETKVVDFYLDLTTLDSGIQKRDRDMRETLKTDKYPFAEFYGKIISDFDLNSSSIQKVLVKGSFKIHGVEKEKEFSGTLKITSEGLLLTGNWILRLEDYDIEPPSLLFVKVDQEQKIEIEALLKPTIEE
ncbi:MAG: YceI family protein [Candidatus Paceibacterota bacterium]